MKFFKFLLPLAILAFALPAAAHASTPMTGETSWSAKTINKVRLAGSLSLGSGSTYNQNNGSVNFVGTLGKKKLQVRSLRLRDKTLSGVLGKARVNLATISGASGSLFQYNVQSEAKLTSSGARALQKKGMKGAKKGRSIGTLRVQGLAVHQIKSGTATITFNATLVNQFQYLTNPVTNNFASFAALAGALPLSSNGVFQTVYAAQLAENPAYLDNRVSTPLVLNPNCIVATAGSGPNALPNTAEASCAPATGVANSEIVFPATGGTLIGGKQAKDFMHDGGLGLQLRLGSATLPAGGPNYGALTAAAGNGIGGSVLQDPGIDTTNGGVNFLSMLTSQGRLPIANLPEWNNSVVCEETPDAEGNYACTASADTSLTALAAIALSDSFGTSIPPDTNLGSLVTEFKIGS